MANRGIEILPPAAQFPATNWLFQETKQTVWTPEEDKCFEKALAFYDDKDDYPDRWLKIAAAVPGKTVADVIRRYKELEDDVSDIEAGLIPLPGYAASEDGGSCFELQSWRFSGGDFVFGGKRCSSAASLRPTEKERKKGIPWTEEEHRRFLMGLKKYGKGDWRNISRNFVTTRTPTQVASHAQKYFIRQLAGGKDKRRSSIHDITTVNVPDHDHNSYSYSSSAATAADSLDHLFPPQNAGHGFAFASSFGSSCNNAFQPWN
ncbi:PREDICTED: transcription factor DIVARICATA [Tarenaya hassleriana]|uniref:transcription factor DIVARICATA n=1 Tax=Tarenaya hassleriana TaxID=28532 RepID=UPI0008FD16D9|nr:PREDICTED: transcription factor DIVARICATA [Tarenaya hassleriana]